MSTYPPKNDIPGLVLAETKPESPSVGTTLPGLAIVETKTIPNRVAETKAIPAAKKPAVPASDTRITDKERAAYFWGNVRAEAYRYVDDEVRISRVVFAKAYDARDGANERNPIEARGGLKLIATQDIPMLDVVMREEPQHRTFHAGKPKEKIHAYASLLRSMLDWHQTIATSSVIPDEKKTGAKTKTTSFGISNPVSEITDEKHEMNGKDEESGKTTSSSGETFPETKETSRLVNSNSETSTKTTSFSDAIPDPETTTSSDADIDTTHSETTDFNTTEPETTTSSFEIKKDETPQEIHTSIGTVETPKTTTSSSETKDDKTPQEIHASNGNVENTEKTTSSRVEKEHETKETKTELDDKSTGSEDPAFVTTKTTSVSGRPDSTVASSAKKNAPSRHTQKPWHVLYWFNQLKLHQQETRLPELQNLDNVQLKRYTKWLKCTPDDFRTAIGAVAAYAHPIQTTYGFAKLGWALYRFFSFVNHSCRPNAWPVFTSTGNVILYSLQPIAKGDEITVSYDAMLELYDSTVAWNDLAPLRTGRFVCECREVCRDRDRVEDDVKELKEATEHVADLGVSELLGESHPITKHVHEMLPTLRSEIQGLDVDVTHRLGIFLGTLRGMVDADPDDSKVKQAWRILYHFFVPFLAYGTMRHHQKIVQPYPKTDKKNKTKREIKAAKQRWKVQQERRVQHCLLVIDLLARNRSPFGDTSATMPRSLKTVLVTNSCLVLLLSKLLYTERRIGDVAGLCAFGSKAKEDPDNKPWMMRHYLHLYEIWEPMFISCGFLSMNADSHQDKHVNDDLIEVMVQHRMRTQRFRTKNPEHVTP